MKERASRRPSASSNLSAVLGRHWPDSTFFRERKGVSSRHAERRSHDGGEQRRTPRASLSCRGVLPADAADSGRVDDSQKTGRLTGYSAADGVGVGRGSASAGGASGRQQHDSSHFNRFSVNNMCVGRRDKRCRLQDRPSGERHVAARKEAQIGRRAVEAVQTSTIDQVRLKPRMRPVAQRCG